MLLLFSMSVAPHYGSVKWGCKTASNLYKSNGEPYAAEVPYPASSGSSSTWLPLRNSPPSRLPWSGPVSSFRSSLAATSTSPSDECPFVKLPGQWMCIKTAGVLAGTVTGSPATLCFTCLFTPAQQSSIARWLEPSPSLYIYISVCIYM